MAGPATLVLEGEAGIGKTTLWAECLRNVRERGALVLEARPSNAETEMAYAGLTDLLDGLPSDVLERLPGPQRTAIDVALGRVEAPAGHQDALTLSTALRAALTRAAEDRPVVVAIDDVQWLDAASRDAVQFALRRLRDERVSLLLTRRSEAGVVSDASGDVLARDRGVEPRTVAGLGTSAIGSILRQHLETSFPQPTVVRIAETAQGNPFFALEIGRALLRDGQRPVPGRPVDIPANLHDLVRSRIAALSDGALEVLLVAACLSRPREDTVIRAVGDAGRAQSSLEESERASIIAMRAGAIAFTHPLLASAIYGNAPEIQRRRLHLRLADVVEDEDERARHLALATHQPDETVAAQLEHAARRARSRGAPAAAALLLEQAGRLTPASDAGGSARRLMEAADAHLSSGDARYARKLLESLVSETEGPARAAALARLATVIWATDGDRAGLDAFMAALPAAAGDATLEGNIHDSLAWLTCWLGDMSAAYDHIQRARKAAEFTGDPALLARVFDKYGQIEFQIGRGPGIDSAVRASGYERAAGGGIGEATLNESLIMTWADRLEEARALLSTHLADATDAGDERLRTEILSRLVLVALRAGDWTDADAWLVQAEDIALAAGLDVGGIQRAKASLDAFRGNVDEARRISIDGLSTARERGQAWVIIKNLGLLGFIDLSLGDFTPAAAALDEADALCERVGVGEPGIFRTQADAVEALVGAGNLARAAQVLERFEQQAAAVGRPWALATSLRCRALLLAANGDESGALAAQEIAVERSRELRQPFEHARTLFLSGTVLRRAGRNRDARQRLGEAEAGFERLGARKWLARARAERGRISGRAPGTHALTPTELRVADLVAAGLSNQQVADRLFVTVRTVESNLTRAYAKLGITSRTQLARRLAQSPEIAPV